MNSTAMAILFCGLTYLLVHEGDKIMKQNTELCLLVIALWIATFLCALVSAAMGN